MKLYNCNVCGQLTYFENVSCVRCGAKLGFRPDQLALEAIEANDDGTWHAVGDATARYRLCANYTGLGVCNWLVASEEDNAFCVACRLNRTIPDLSVAGHLALWHKLEIEKRRLVYSLLRLGLPLVPRDRDASGLAFDFLADTEPRFSERGRVITGHAQGLITLNVAEADPVVRERMRAQMAEPYRTMLGHFRHESGHYYWERMIAGQPWLEPFRAIFGDETRDYTQALDRHYEQGPPADWPEHYVSAYASSHPWEDWAETWAHYLHILDTSETAQQFGLEVRPRAGDDETLTASHDIDPYRYDAVESLIGRWLPLTYALNSLNRSMGHEHLYPFVLSPAVIDKLAFVHRVVRNPSGA
ncbi:putative zinc-binding peptidase [Thioalkalicoccus limnaeus]|uniref:Zinc-binding peptidase n=1 Tax=Thioalkalicoccus limnaeus TaxID=120681 RepID=A0ABV4B9S7_9GAMM